MTNPTAPAIVPELLVSDLEQSLGFWRDLCGFEILYRRPEDLFAYLTRDGAHLMLEQYGIGRNWETGPLERPFGRGINFQINLPECASIADRLAAAKIPLFMDMEEKWYRANAEEIGVRQFIVQDPDGYLVRFQSSLGRRAAAQD